MYEKPSNPEDEGAGYGYSNGMQQQERDVFFYHSDHLGSTSYITDRNGNATQFVSYKPYGESLVDEHATSFEMPWKFNGKELDSETGLYYYGARYYEPVLALWYGVDALAEKNSSQSPYNYCVGNPISFIDPCGTDTFRISDKRNIQHIYGGENDVFTDSKGKVLATVNGNKTKLKHVYDKDNDLGYDILMFPDRKDAEKLFKAIADQSENEWSLIETGEYGKGFVSTSFGRMEERAGGHIFLHKKTYIGQYNSVWRHIHSHPRAMDLIPSMSDRMFVQSYMEKQGFEKTKYYIYGPQTQYMLQYFHTNKQPIFMNIDNLFRAK